MTRHFFLWNVTRAWGKRRARQPVLMASVMLLLAACGQAWQQDPAVQAARDACVHVESQARFACIQSHAVAARDPDVCRLAGTSVDDACLQAVYEAAQDPAVCDRLYLEGVRPTCRAYYAALPPPGRSGGDRGLSWVGFSRSDIG